MFALTWNLFFHIFIANDNNRLLRFSSDNYSLANENYLNMPGSNKWFEESA